MDFRFDDEKLALIEHVRKFARKVLSESVRQRISDSVFERELWNRAAHMGLAGLPIPIEWSGSGFGALDTMLMVEALGNGCTDMGLVFSLCAHMFACAVPIWRQGNDDQRKQYLHRIAKGELIAANAITEPESGSDAYAMRSSATRDGDTYVLQGQKCFVTNAPVADLFLIYAKTDPTQGFFGVSGFLIPRDTPGLTIANEGQKIGLRTSPWGTLYMDNCRISASALLGEEGAGAPMFHDSMIWERGCLFASYVGAMERFLRLSIEHARERKQFGQSIGRNQSISNRLVDMKLRLETSRLLLYRAGWLYDQGEPYEEAIALSKLWISECSVLSGLDAMQIFGGTGMISDAGVDQLLLDALPSKIFSGTSEIQKELIARNMGLR